MRKIVKLLICFLVFGVIIKLALADDPYGPEAIKVEKSERGNISTEAPKIVYAEAGNVTQLTINTTLITKYWQGYYGNISGRITLEDGRGYTFYDWPAGPNFSPLGEIYAANSTISNWQDVICVKLNGNGVPGEDGINKTIIENYFNMNPISSDGIDETFTKTRSIQIGTRTLNNCPATNTYVNSQAQDLYFNETILTENSTGTIIFATQVDQNTIGYDGSPWDFQMIVGDNGLDSSATQYYFYLELA